MSDVSALLDVFSADDIARAAGADRRDIQALIDAGRVPTIDGRFVAAGPAVDVVRSLRSGTPLQGTAPALFRQLSPPRRDAGAPLVGSAVAHAVVLGGLVLMTMGSARPAALTPPDRTNLVFLMAPGPGGGGGGGGLRQAAAARAERQGTQALRSPVPTRRVVEGKPVPAKPIAPPRIDTTPVPEPPPVERAPQLAPPVIAPVATVAADVRDREGLPTVAAPDSENRGPGIAGGAGTGNGAGLGSGQGGGLGPGSGGGTGGGPYRPGSGVAPPSLLHEVKPDYTEEARRRGVTGDVELEIVVRSDGTVGEVRLQRGLGAGLDQRAIDAVRQWRFSPARRLGTPVDVVVEVAVEFKLR